MKFNDNYLLLQNVIKKLSLDHIEIYEKLEKNGESDVAYQKIIDDVRDTYPGLPDPPLDDILGAFSSLFKREKNILIFPKEKTSSQIKDEFNIQIQKTREEFKNAGLEFPIKPKNEWKEEDFIEYLIFDWKLMDVLKLENWEKSSKLKDACIKIQEIMEKEYPLLDIPTEDEIIKVFQTIEEEQYQTYQDYQKILVTEKKLKKDDELREKEKRTEIDKRKQEEMQQIASEKQKKIEEDKRKKSKEDEDKNTRKLINEIEKIKEETKKFFDQKLKDILGDRWNKKISEYTDEIPNIIQELGKCGRSLDVIHECEFTNCTKILTKYIEFYPNGPLESIKVMTEKVKMRYEYLADDKRSDYCH